MTEDAVCMNRLLLLATLLGAGCRPVDDGLGGQEGEDFTDADADADTDTDSDSDADTDADADTDTDTDADTDTDTGCDTGNAGDTGDSASPCDTGGSGTGARRQPGPPGFFRRMFDLWHRL